MIKVTDLRNLDIPQVSKEDMEDIGQAYILSGKKKLYFRYDRNRNKNNGKYSIKKYKERNGK